MKTNCRDLRVFGVKFRTQFFIRVKKWHYATLRETRPQFWAKLWSNALKLISSQSSVELIYSIQVKPNLCSICFLFIVGGNSFSCWVVWIPSARVIISDSGSIVPGECGLRSFLKNVEFWLLEVGPTLGALEKKFKLGWDCSTHCGSSAHWIQRFFEWSLKVLCEFFLGFLWVSLTAFWWSSPGGSRLELFYKFRLK